jgi:hypothetical protein
LYILNDCQFSSQGLLFGAGNCAGACAQPRVLIGCPRQVLPVLTVGGKTQVTAINTTTKSRSFVGKRESRREAQSPVVHRHNGNSVVRSIPQRMSEFEGGDNSMEEGTAVVAGEGGDAADVAAVEQRPPTRRSHQFRALSRRTATYHRRQWKLDLCCLGLCPA